MTIFSFFYDILCMYVTLPLKRLDILQLGPTKTAEKPFYNAKQGNFELT